MQSHTHTAYVYTRTRARALARAGARTPYARGRPSRLWRRPARCTVRSGAGLARNSCCFLWSACFHLWACVFCFTLEPPAQFANMVLSLFSFFLSLAVCSVVLSPSLCSLSSTSPQASLLNLPLSVCLYLSLSLSALQRHVPLSCLDVGTALSAYYCLSS